MRKVVLAGALAILIATGGALSVLASAAGTSNPKMATCHGRGATTTTTSRGPTAGRTLVFDDEFSGGSLDQRRWSKYFSAGDGGNGLRRPSAISLDGSGHLVITARMINGTIVSGGMSANRNDINGYYEVCVRTDVDPTGTTSGVVLTWPQSGNWPTDGECDIYETGNAAGTRTPFYSFVHYSSTNKQYWFRHKADASQWHMVGMDWTANAIKIYRDGVLVWTITDPAAIPDVAHHIALQLDATATRTLTRTVRMHVDYVRIWR
jgi:beta-glucanase (GH16 family)